MQVADVVAELEYLLPLLTEFDSADLESSYSKYIIIIAQLKVDVNQKLK